MSASSLVVAVAVAVAVACARGGRVVSASRTRHLATSPSRRHASLASQLQRTPHLVLLYSYFVRPLCCVCISFSFLVRRTRTQVPVLRIAFTSRGHASLRIPVALFNAFVARPRPLLSNFITTYSLSVRAAFTSRCDCQLVRRSVVALNRMSLFSVETSHYRLPRRASRA